MTHPRPLRRFDPFRPIDMLTSLWSSEAVSPVSSGARRHTGRWLMTVRRLGWPSAGGPSGRRRSDADGTEFDSRLDVRGLSVGPAQRRPARCP